MVEQTKKQIDWNVVFVSLSVVFFIGAHMFTIISIGQRTNMAQQLKLEYDVTKTAEANPLTALWLRLKGVGYIFDFGLIPAMVFGYFFYMRKKHPDQASFVAMFFFLLSLSNVMNDLAYYLAEIL